VESLDSDWLDSDSLDSDWLDSDSLELEPLESLDLLESLDSELESLDEWLLEYDGSLIETE